MQASKLTSDKTGCIVRLPRDLGLQLIPAHYKSCSCPCPKQPCRLAIHELQLKVQENDIILCDGPCNRAYHFACVRPPITEADISEEEGWLCPACDTKVPYFVWHALTGQASQRLMQPSAQSLGCRWRTVMYCSYSSLTCRPARRIAISRLPAHCAQAERRTLNDLEMAQDQNLHRNGQQPQLADRGGLH